MEKNEEYIKQCKFPLNVVHGYGSNFGNGETKNEMKKLQNLFNLNIVFKPIRLYNKENNHSVPIIKYTNGKSDLLNSNLLSANDQKIVRRYIGEK